MPKRRSTWPPPRYPSPQRTYYLGTGALKGILGPTIWVLGGLGIVILYVEVESPRCIGLWTLRACVPKLFLVRHSFEALTCEAAETSYSLSRV